MNLTSYYGLGAYAGPHLLRWHPWPVPAALPFPLHVATAVYIVFDHDGVCCYVGSVSRGTGGLTARMSEHLGDPAKRATWHTAWVLPLRAHTPLAEVRRIEGLVGAHLKPRDSHRLPVPRPRIRADRRRRRAVRP